MTSRIFSALAALFGMTEAHKRPGPPYQNPLAEHHVNILPPFKPSIMRRIVAGKPIIRDDEKIAKAEAKRARRQERNLKNWK